jgi:membrane-associated phospholipid phosphatase
MRTDTDNAALRWRTYGYWAGINLLVFGVVYPLVNWLTGIRAHNYDLYLDSERTIPFFPAWIWVYLSINLLFMAPPLVMRASAMPLLGKRMLAATLAACAIFLILPARLGFERVVPEDALYQAVFSALFRADGPHNLMPSLHVSYASLCILSCQSAAHGRLGRVAWGLWLLAIVMSTVLVHQHHLLDIASGLVLAGVICLALPSRDCP